ncbi:MAG: hypothetical protein WBL28_02015, partial [Methylotenera sp.]
SDILPMSAVAPTTKDIPYDYVAKFKLQGKAGNRVQDVINISVEGGFVAVAIGYSFIPAKLQITNPTPVATLAANSLSGLIDLLSTADRDTLAQCLFVRLCGIDFKYSIVDSGTGRELQNQPIHNIAGLGEASGDRPFRPLAKPMMFMPRSTIRIEVEEISEGSIYTGAELYIVLHGYKILGYGTAMP